MKSGKVFPAPAGEAPLTSELRHASLPPERDPCGEGALGTRMVTEGGQSHEATLEDRGVRGAFLCCDGKELPLAFANIQREKQKVTVNVHAAVSAGIPIVGIVLRGKGYDHAEAQRQLTFLDVELWSVEA